jgi:hypothetical protein
MSCIICGSRSGEGMCYEIGGMEVCLCLEHAGMIDLVPGHCTLS